MSLLNDLISVLPDGGIARVCIGPHWTAVVAGGPSGRQCGLATTLRGDHSHGEGERLPAGRLAHVPGCELAGWSESADPVRRSVGLATINALLPLDPDSWVDRNAEGVLITRGAGKRVVLVGRFPFVERVRRAVGELIVLELTPGPGELPAASAADVIPGADLVAITSMTLLNGTFEGLRDLCSREALVLLLGPSTPLNPVVFDHGVDVLCGSVVADIDRVLCTIEQGGTFRQVHRAGVELVTIARPGL